MNARLMALVFAMYATSRLYMERRIHTLRDIRWAVSISYSQYLWAYQSTRRIV